VSGTGYDPGGIAGPPGPAGELVGLPGVTELRAELLAPNRIVALETYDPNNGTIADQSLFQVDFADGTDNGVTRFNAGGLGSVGPGWERIYSGPIDVRWAGAVGDGVIDDTTAIQRALDVAGTKGSVYIPPQLNFLISATLVLASEGVRLFGDRGSRLVASDATFDMLEVRANDIELANFELWGAAPDDTTVQYGVVTNGTPAYIQGGAGTNFAGIGAGDTFDVTIDGNAYNIVFAAGDTTLAKVINRINSFFGGGPEAYCAIEGTVAGRLALASRSLGPLSTIEVVGGTATADLGFAAGTTAGTGFRALRTVVSHMRFGVDGNRLNNGLKVLSGCDYWRVEDCDFTLMGFDGAVGNGYGLNTGSRGLQLKNNTFVCDPTGGRHLVYLGGGARDCQILGNVIVNSNANGINGTSLATQLPNLNNIVSANTISNQVASADGFSFAAISLTGGFYDTLIEANIIRDIGDHGIYMSGLGQILDNIGTPHNATIKNNTISDCGKHGILLETVSRAAVHDNYIRDVGLAAAGTYVGIQAAAYAGATTICDRIVCRNNTVRASDPASPVFAYSIRFDPTAGQGPTNSAIIDNELMTGVNGIIAYDATVLPVLALNRTDTSTVVPTEGTVVVTGSYIGTTVLTAGTTFGTSNRTKKIKLRMVGGGGGGGGVGTAAVSAALGGGGSAGAYAEKTFTVTPSTNYTYAIGAGGAGGTNAPTNGSAGGDTTFSDGVTTVTCPGGLGGNASNAGVAVQATGSSGHSNVATNGDLNTYGAEGAPGLRFSGTIGCSGSGGNSQFGAGGRSFNSGSAGQAGAGYGAGGGGGAVTNGSAAVAGGDGVQGVIIVDEFA